MMTTRQTNSEETLTANELPGERTFASEEDVEKQQSQAGGGKDPNIVTWDKDDKDNPFNWSSGYKAWITFQLGMLAMAGSVASSIVSPANETISRYMGVSKEVGVLSVSLYV